MKGPLGAECSEIWERGCFNELAGPVWHTHTHSLTHTLTHTPGEQEQPEQALETKREAGISLKLEMPSKPHVGGPLSSRWGRAGGRGAGVQALVPASHAPRSPSLIALIIWNGAKHDGNGNLHASPGNGVCLCLSAPATVSVSACPSHQLSQPVWPVRYSG